jgi:hypothetical protein
MNPNEDLAALERNWKPPVELSSYGPRDVRLSAGGVAIACFAALMFAGAIAAGVGLSRLGARQQAARDSLRAAGGEVEAVVTRHWRTGGKNDTPKVAYEFEYAGQTYHGSSNAPGRIWRTLSVGSPITVRFVPSNPQLNHPSEWDSNVLPRLVPPLTAASLVLLGLLMVFVIRREIRLLSDGRPALARVTKVSRHQHGHLLRYEFATLNGGVAKGRSESRKAHPVGAAICVLYDRENPKRNAPYPLKLVRVDR